MNILPFTMLPIVIIIVFFIVGNPYTYAIMSKLTGLKLKVLEEHMILVGIHSLVMGLVMFGILQFVSVESKKTKVVVQEKKPTKPKAEPSSGNGSQAENGSEAGNGSQAENPVQTPTVEGFSF